MILRERVSINTQLVVSTPQFWKNIRQIGSSSQFSGRKFIKLQFVSGSLGTSLVANLANGLPGWWCSLHPNRCNQMAPSRWTLYLARRRPGWAVGMDMTIKLLHVNWGVGNETLETKWFFFQKYGVKPAQIINFHRVFHEINHPFWGKTRIFGNTQGG